MNKPINISAFYDEVFSDPLDGADRLLEEQIESRVRAVLTDEAALSSRLKPLPAVALKLTELLRSDAVPFDKLAEIINQDPSLAMQIMKVVNSPLYRGTVEIRDLKDAIARLGVDGVSSLAMSIAMAALRPPKPIYFKIFGKVIWSHSLHCAHLCQKLAAHEGLDPFTAHFLGLIHDIGKIIIYECLLEVLTKSALAGDPGSEPFKNLMTEMSLDISYFVAREWQLPEDLCDALQQQQYFKELSPLADCLHRANACAELYLLLQKGLIAPENISDILAIYKCPEHIWTKFFTDAESIGNIS